MKMYCVIDGNEIDDEKVKRKAVTCSHECKLLLKAFRRKQRSEIICSACRRPSTPEERQEFKRWRRETQPSRPQGRPPLTPEEKQAKKEAKLREKELRAKAKSTGALASEGG